jgi:hypothetical protein
MLSGINRAHKVFLPVHRPAAPGMAQEKGALRHSRRRPLRLSLLQGPRGDRDDNQLVPPDQPYHQTILRRVVAQAGTIFKRAIKNIS